MEAKDKKLIAIVITIAFVLVIALTLLFSHLISKNSPDQDAGLFKSQEQTAEDNQPVRQTEQERLEEYESREEMPAVAEENFYDTISRLLSTGKFDELDHNLRYWQETYKDSTDESESKSAMIAWYRGDIAYYKTIEQAVQGNAVIWQYRTPDTLAASIAFSPIMKKYSTFVNQDSILMPAMSVGTNINLRESEKTNEELIELKNAINRNRTDDTAYQQIAVYEMTLSGYPCEFIAVMDRETMTWIPYSLKVTNGMIDLPTVAIGKQILNGNPMADLDVTIVVPAAISERPEGMTGNIDYSQQGIQDSQNMTPVVVDDLTPAGENPAGEETGETSENGEETPVEEN